MNAIMTKHVVNDRMDRMLMIAEHIGWGEPMIQRYDSERNNLVVITTTGVMLIKSADNQKLITAYVAHMDQVIAICRKCGFARVPNALYAVVVKNQKKVAKWG